MVELAEVRLKERNYVGAESLLREAVGNDEKTNSDSWEQWHSQSLLGASLAGQGKYAESEAPLISGYRGMIDREATIPFEERSASTQAGEWIVQLYKQWGQPEKAAEWHNNLCRRKDAALRGSECSTEGIVAGKS